MTSSGASVSAESFAATSVNPPKLMLADLPDAIGHATPLPVLARLPDYGMRLSVRKAKSATVESVVRRWFGQRAALAILVGSGILMAAMAIAPFVGRSAQPEPVSPQPTWEPITDQSTHHAPSVPRFETNAAMPVSTATGPLAAPQAADNRTQAQPKQEPRPGVPTSTIPAHPRTSSDSSSTLTRLPPVEKTQAATEQPEVRRPITVDELFSASAAQSVPNSPLARGNPSGTSGIADVARPTGGAETAPPIDSPFAQHNAPSQRDGNRVGPNTPLVDRRLSPPPYQPPHLFDKQTVSAVEAAGPGTAQLEGVIETPSLRANYDPTHSQRY